METAHLRSLIEEALREHLDSRVKVTVHESERISDHTKARASGLGLCALKTPLERHFPSTPNINAAMLMAHGTQIGGFYQDALVSYASRHPFITAEPEVDGSTDEIVGKPDIIITDYSSGGFDGAVIEMKYTSNADGTGGKIRPHYAFQLMAYYMKYPVTPFIMTIGKGNMREFSFRLWRMEMGDGGFYIVDEDGEPFKAPWNKPEIINPITVKGLAAEQIFYAQEVDKLVNGLITHIQPPFADPLNDPNAWQCLDINTKTGTAKPSCPFAGRCFGIVKETPFEKTEDGKQWKAAF